MPKTLTASGFSQEAFDSFLATRDEPGWLTDLRRTAWRRFLELEMPSRHEEEWLRTDIRLFKLERYGIPGDPPQGVETPRALLAEGVQLGGRTTTIDGAPIDEQLADKWASKGVLFGDLSTLAARHGDVLRPFLERRLVDPNRDKFSALNAACWSGGAVLYVPRRLAIDEPFHALSAATDGGVDLNKTLIILDEGAEATMLAETASTGENADGFHCGSIELVLEPGARLRYVNLQNWGDRVWHFAHQKAHVAARGACSGLSARSGAGWPR